MRHFIQEAEHDSVHDAHLFSTDSPHPESSHAVITKFGSKHSDFQKLEDISTPGRNEMLSWPPPAASKIAPSLKSDNQGDDANKENRDFLGCKMNAKGIYQGNRSGEANTEQEHNSCANQGEETESNNTISELETDNNEFLPFDEISTPKCGAAAGWTIPATDIGGSGDRNNLELSPPSYDRYEGLEDFCIVKGNHSKGQGSDCHSAQLRTPRDQSSPKSSTEAKSTDVSKYGAGYMLQTLDHYLSTKHFTAANNFLATIGSYPSQKSTPRGKYK